LNLADNKITKIQNLQHCAILQSLHLYQNKIEVIEGLDFCI